METYWPGKARDFAIKAHGDQKRKYTGVPYWHHLEEVAQILMRYSASPWWSPPAGCTTRSRTPTPPTRSWSARFGMPIANLVIEVTDVSQRSSGNTPEGVGNRILRKQIDRQFLAGASARGQMLKCADMLSNTKNIVEHGGNFARVYVPEKKLLIGVLDRARETYYEIWRAAYDQIVRAEPVISAAA
jgi:GTP diphosphokinase / guanosine-3',5'-bis(diphosphate) 3'-diphosphatase